MVVRDVAASSCRSHLILMTANYPLRWDPVPAGCHGDIARASVNAGAAAGNHPDPELTGKGFWPPMLWLTRWLPLCALTTNSQFVIIKRASLHLPESPWAPFHCLCLNTATPQLTPAGRQNGNSLFPWCLGHLDDPVRLNCEWKSCKDIRLTPFILKIKYFSWCDLHRCNAQPFDKIGLYKCNTLWEKKKIV